MQPAIIMPFHNACLLFLSPPWSTNAFPPPPIFGTTPSNPACSPIYIASIALGQCLTASQAHSALLFRTQISRHSDFRLPYINRPWPLAIGDSTDRPSILVKKIKKKKSSHRGSFLSPTASFTGSAGAVQSLRALPQPHPAHQHLLGGKTKDPPSGVLYPHPCRHSSPPQGPGSRPTAADLSAC